MKIKLEIIPDVERVVPTLCTSINSSVNMFEVIRNKATENWQEDTNSCFHDIAIGDTLKIVVYRNWTDKVVAHATIKVVNIEYKLLRSSDTDLMTYHYTFYTVESTKNVQFAHTSFIKFVDELPPVTTPESNHIVSDHSGKKPIKVHCNSQNATIIDGFRIGETRDIDGQYHTGLFYAIRYGQKMLTQWNTLSGKSEQYDAIQIYQGTERIVTLTTDYYVVSPYGCEHTMQLAPEYNPDEIINMLVLPCVECQLPVQE